MAVAACAAVLAPGAGSALAAPSRARGQDDDDHGRRERVQVQAVEGLGPKGSVTFVVTNKGKTSHDFKINGKMTPTIGAGKSATLIVTFAKAGKFPYLCTVPGHAAAGMKGTFTVT